MAEAALTFNEAASFIMKSARVIRKVCSTIW